MADVPLYDGPGRTRAGVGSVLAVSVPTQTRPKFRSGMGPGQKANARPFVSALWAAVCIRFDPNARG